jgi:hypothetical protein
LASAAEASGVATAITVRGATKLAGSLGSATVGVAGGAITKSGGLVVDGFAAIADVLRKPLEGRH